MSDSFTESQTHFYSNFSTTENITTAMWELPLTNQRKPVDYDKDFWEKYDYKGAILFVFGLLIMYGSAILILVIAMIRRSRSELVVLDQLRDLEEMRKERCSKKRSSRWKLSSLTDKLNNKSTSIDDPSLDEHPITKLVETRVKLYQSTLKEESSV